MSCRDGSLASEPRAATAGLARSIEDATDLTSPAVMRPGTKQNTVSTNHIRRQQFFAGLVPFLGDKAGSMEEY